MKLFLSLLLTQCCCSCFGDNSGLNRILRTEQMLENIGILTKDLLYKLEPGHCYTLITDPLYQAILQSELFQEISHSSYFVINVPYNEDFLQTTEDEIITTLKEANKVGCKCYLIYLANGNQMGRFFHFINRERVIDPSVRLIILHDNRLFISRMHYLWKRFINVIFVRQYEQSNQISNRRFTENKTAFELTTVPYPMPISELFVTKTIDFWRNGKYRYGTKLNIDKTKNLHGQQMLICVLKHTPGISDPKSTGEYNLRYAGLEIEIILGLSQSLNFTAEFYESEDAASEQWGTKTENNTYTGLIGEMVEGVAQIALGDLYYVPYFLDAMDLSIPYTAQCLTFLTPEALTDNSWQTLVLPFSDEMWAGVLFFLFCVGFVFYIFEHINLWIQKDHHRTSLDDEESKNSMTKGNIKHISGTRVLKLDLSENAFVGSKFSFKKQRKIRQKDLFDGFTDCLLFTYSMQLVVSLPRFPTKWAVRILTGSYWIYCILIVVAYRASLTAILANPAPRLTIDTLHELSYSPISCGVSGEHNRQIFITPTDDEDSKKIASKIETIRTASEAISRVSQGKFAYFENVYFLKEMRFHHDQIESNKLKYLHIMKECAVNMPVSIGLERNSPLKPRFDRLLRQIIEAGLISKWLSDSVQKFDASEEEQPREALMNLKKLYGILIAILVGFFLATLALIIENIYWKFVTKRNPHYDKYDFKKLYRTN